MTIDPDYDLVALVNAANGFVHAADDGSSDAAKTKHYALFMASLASLSEKYGPNLEGLEVPDGTLDRLTGVARVCAVVGAVKTAAEILGDKG